MPTSHAPLDRLAFSLSRCPKIRSRRKRDAFPPPCPQVGGCPQASPHPATTQDEFDFGESRNQQPANSLSLFSPEAVQTTGTVAQRVVAAGGPWAQCHGD